MIFAAFYYWYPEDDGPHAGRAAGQVAFLAVGHRLPLTFDFMHIPGLLGMPRQIYTYEPDRGWTMLEPDRLASARFIQAIAVLIFVFNLVHSYFKGERPAPIRGMRGRWSGPRPRRRRPTTSPSIRWSQPPAAVGPEASGRSGFSHSNEAERNDEHDSAGTRNDTQSQWKLPSRGVVGMARLIVAESAIFTIFVVAYLYYMGRDVTGPHAARSAGAPDLRHRSACFRAAASSCSRSARIEHGQDGGLQAVVGA